MTLMPHADAVLILDVRDAETTGEYEVFSLPSTTDLDQLRGEWDRMREGLTSTGRIPICNVEFDQATEFRVPTFGIERFATAA